MFACRRADGGHLEVTSDSHVQRQIRPDRGGWTRLGETWRRYAGGGLRAPAQTTGCKADQTSTNVRCAQVAGRGRRQMTHVNSSIPLSHTQRPASRVHQLAGSALPGRVAGNDPPLDGRGAHQLLPHARRAEAVLACSARRVHLIDAARCARRAHPPGWAHQRQRGLKAASGSAGAAGCSAGEPAELLAQAPVEGRSGQLCERTHVASEARADRGARLDLPHGPAVDCDVERLE